MLWFYFIVHWRTVRHPSKAAYSQGTPRLVPIRMVGGGYGCYASIMRAEVTARRRRKWADRIMLSTDR